ncbi:hypothetical protein MTO96_025540 [Rhipicephalus appendiculatus]
MASIAASATQTRVEKRMGRTAVGMSRGNPGAGWHRQLASCCERHGLRSSGSGLGYYSDLRNPPAIQAWLSSPKSFITPATLKYTTPCYQASATVEREATGNRDARRLHSRVSRAVASFAWCRSERPSVYALDFRSIGRAWTTTVAVTYIPQFRSWPGLHTVI